VISDANGVNTGWAELQVDKYFTAATLDIIADTALRYPLNALLGENSVRLPHCSLVSVSAVVGSSRPCRSHVNRSLIRRLPKPSQAF
jgi:hypothetical protein